MFETFLDLLNSMSLLPYGKVDEGEESEEEEEESDADEDEGEKKKADEKTPKSKPKMYSEDTVKRLRYENGRRRKKQREGETEIADLKKQVRDLKSGRTADDKKKKSAANGRLETEIDELKTTVSELTSQRDDLVELQTQTDRVLIIGRVADEIGFVETSDAVAFLSTKSEDFTNADGEIDEDALRFELEELIEKKPYLARPAVQDRKDKVKKGRKEASKRGNPPEDQEIKSQDIKKGVSRSEEDTNKKIRQLLNKNHDGRAALSVFLGEKYLPKTRKEEVTVR